VTQRSEPKSLRGHLAGQVKRSFARESFPPKWLLVIAILAVIIGLSLANYRITSAEAQLTRFAQSVDEACGAKAPTFKNAVNVCEQAADKATEAPAAPVPGVVLQAPQSGKDGRGISDLTCVLGPDGTGRWQVTYTDAVVDRDGGPCYTPPNPK
jgi:hypothetical protein